MEKQTLVQLARDLKRSLCNCAPASCDLLQNDPGLCRTLIRLLAEGQPVPMAALARAAGRSVADVAALVRASGDVEVNAQGRVVGAGLTLRTTPHRLQIADRTLYTWCALDALMYPPLLDRTVRVTSPCAASGAPVHLTVTAAGPQDVTPAEAVVSIVTPDGSRGVRQGFCSDVHFFRSAGEAQPWLEQHPGARLLSVAEAYELGRQLVAHG